MSGIDAGTPLFDSGVSFTNQALDLPLSLVVTSGASISLEIDYQPSRFSEQSITRLLGHLKVILQSILQDHDQAIQAIPLLSDAENQTMLVDWNNSAIDYPDDKCLHELFEQRVEKDGDAIAAIFEDQQLTYEQLNAKANQLANCLRQHGAGPGQLVAIAVSRNLHMPIAMLAVAKSGAAYVPLDPSYPEERLAFMLEDTQALILLTEAELQTNFSTFKNKALLIDQDWPEIAQQDSANLNTGVTPQDLAYVIYTSGSTGRPKGAVLNHQGRVNNFCDFNRRYSIGPGDKLLALASISFDMSVYDIFGTLMCGGTVVIADASSIQGAANWAPLMIQHGITVWHSVPALMEMLVDYVEGRDSLTPDALRLVLLGGDWIPVALPDRLKALVPTMQVVSMGGATEVSMDSTIYDVNEPSSQWKSIPYGFPMANQLTYVLDKYLQPLPIGVPGELHLGGVGVGEGYWKREQLSAEKFIANPFRPGERLYKTGDLARFGEDGNLELLGRIDFQVKVRGFRIELGEIESRLRKHPAVKECVLMAVDDGSEQARTKEKRIVAYVLAGDDIGELETDSEQRQVEQWAAVYDAAYSKGEGEKLTDETFNIVSWDSSYTEHPYPEDTMRTWVDSTVARISQHHPRRVLEIGCGTGLLLFRIAPTCDDYHGTDISPVALDHVAQQKQKLNLQQVRIEQRFGDNFSGMENSTYDALVLNSIVMDFPNIDYLTRVLRGVAKRIDPGGFMFVGDVRDRKTHSYFHTSVQLHKARSSLELEKLQQVIRRQVTIEEEMLIDPAYFVVLQQQIPEITALNIQYKRGRNDNEMSKFRYDVKLFIGDNQRLINDLPAWIDWQTSQMSLHALGEHLKQNNDARLAISNIPNARVTKELVAARLIEEGACETVRDLRLQLEADAEIVQAIDPEDLWVLAAKLNRPVEIHYSHRGDESVFDAVFLTAADEGKTCVNLFTLNEQNNSLSAFANDPLLAKNRRKLIALLRQYLSGHLPDYMVPSAFLVLDKFPLSPNGKLNRRALPKPDNLRPELEHDYVAPVSAVEKVLAEFWCQCLDIDKVGLHDGFIALGGNSLSATQVVSRIKDFLEVEVPLNYGIHSTLKELSEQVQVSASQQGSNAEQTAQVYLEVSAMSEEEIQATLSA